MKDGKVCWGIIGCGNIANRFARSLVHQKDSVLYAAAGRNLNKVQAFAAEHNIDSDRAYTSFEDLLENPDIDAVYIALPHQLHAKWSVEAMKAGKAVLCEKPAVVSASQMEEIIECSRKNDVLFTEAMKTRFVPAFRKLEELIQSGKIGKITGMQLSLCDDFGENLLDPSRYYNTVEAGGGLLDEGCYMVHYLPLFLGSSFSIRSMEALCPDGRDIYVNALMDFDGVPVRIENAIDRSKPKVGKITGSLGEVIIEPVHRPTKLTVHTKTESGDIIEDILDIPYEYDDFYSQIDSFVQTLKSGKAENPVMPLEDSLADARILDILRTAALKQGSGH